MHNKIKKGQWFSTHENFFKFGGKYISITSETKMKNIFYVKIYDNNLKLIRNTLWDGIEIIDAIEDGEIVAIKNPFNGTISNN